MSRTPPIPRVSWRVCAGGARVVQTSAVWVPVLPLLKTFLFVALVLCPRAAAAQALERGVPLERVVCADDPTQTYALYLPTAYSPERQWGVIFAFHPAARGPPMVEKFRAAAEQYGYIVAASNNSRNGPHAVSAEAAKAMTADVGRRFSVDPRRVYLSGMSGGARVATGIALANTLIAGVIASSAGFPDSQPRATVPFAVFSTAGTEDFNYMEMRQLDRRLSSPHFLAVFRGGHTLPPDDVAFDAIEWMELQAMRSGRRSRDEALAARMLEKRRARIAASTDVAETVYLLRAVVEDFKGLADVTADERRLEALLRQSDVKKALKSERESDDAEARMLGDIFALEAQLRDDARETALMTLRERLTRLSRRAAGEADTPDRRQARRVLRLVTAGAAERTPDRQYLQLLEQFRLQGR
jgi:predicted esterase